MDIILNERNWMNEALETLSLGKNPYETIGRYARVMHADGVPKDVMERRIEEFLLRCDSRVNLVIWQDAIKRAIARAGKYPIAEVDGVWLTEGELNTISKIESKMQRKLLFTLVCLAKFKMAVNPDAAGWVNYGYKDICNLANITISSKRRALLINDLYRAGYISLSKRIDNTSIHIDILDDSTTNSLFVSDFRNLGNRYLMHCGEKFFECQSCGIVIHRTANHQTFCRQCAEDRHRQLANEQYKRSIA